METWDPDSRLPTPIPFRLPTAYRLSPTAYRLPPIAYRLPHIAYRLSPTIAATTLSIRAIIADPPCRW